jgi:hypothetical protein
VFPVLNKATKAEIAAEIERQLRAEKFAAVDRQLDGHDEKEARPRLVGARRMVAETWSEGLEQARNETPEPGSFTGVGMITIAVDEPRTAEEADAVAVARATEVARREIQSRRAVAAANRAGVEHLGVTEVEVDEDNKIGARLRSLLGLRGAPTDAADEYRIG